MKLKVKRLHSRANLPARHSKYAAGYDLCALDDVTVKHGDKRVIIDTGLSIAIPEGYYGQLFSRSGLSVKNSIQVHAGVIDGDFSGSVGVILTYHGADPQFEIKAGDRIAQLVLIKIAQIPVEEVEELDETERGSGGFGSTGK